MRLQRGGSSCPSFSSSSPPTKRLASKLFRGALFTPQRLEQRALRARRRRRGGRRQTEVLVAAARDLTAARRADQKAFLDKVRFVDELQRVAILGQRRSQRLDADRPAVEALDDRRQDLAVARVQPDRV